MVRTPARAVTATHRSGPAVTRLADASLPTRYGRFRAAIFGVEDEPLEVLALTLGDLDAGDVPLVRLHSECVTGDTLGSLRCDCGEQLEMGLRLIAEAGTGVLVYLRQEGRGIGLVNKLRAYALQDDGLDTVDANKALGLPVDARRYAGAAAVLLHLGLHSVRLLTNNPAKRRALQRAGIAVLERVPLEMTPNALNRPYLETKAALMGHQLLGWNDGRVPTSPDNGYRHGQRAAPIAPMPAPTADRPGVTIHYAQTLDGRIATRTGNSQWISGEESLRFAHALRASHDAIMVGVGTVVTDDPRLSVRHVPGPSPRRIVVDSRLRIPLHANVLVDGGAPTLVATTSEAPEAHVRAVERLGAEVVRVGRDDDGRVDLRALLAVLAGRGVASLLIEGGAGLITSALRSRVVDRLVVAIAPKVVGRGIEAVGDLDIMRLSDAMTFRRAEFARLGEDMLFDGELAPGAA